MILEIRTVSRKTPLDGRLEITPESSARLAALETTLSVVVGEGANATGAVPARLESMSCTCAKGSSNGHVHHFLHGDALHRLQAGASVHVMLDEAGATVRIVPDVATGS